MGPHPFARRLHALNSSDASRNALELDGAPFEFVSNGPDPADQLLHRATDVRRVEALGKLLETEDGKNLLAGYRRAANILRAEEKKDGAEAFAGEYVQTELVPAAERYLADVVASAGAAVRQHVDAEDFEGAMRALATLRSPVDGFFLDVTVNDPDPRTRLNRLRLLNELREAMHAVADFSKVAG